VQEIKHMRHVGHLCRIPCHIRRQWFGT
jgi:hypothetical protein